MYFLTALSNGILVNAFSIEAPANKAGLSKLNPFSTISSLSQLNVLSPPLNFETFEDIGGEKSNILAAESSNFGLAFLL